MGKLIERFSSLVKGSITGFDRIVFKGIIFPLMAAEGAMNFCRTNAILNKDYKKWMMRQTACIIETVDQYAEDKCGQGIIPRVDNNSVKVYNEQNVLRVETTINDPGKFRVFRHKQGQSCHKPKSRLPLRKGVVDIPLRAIVSQEANNRFMDDLATFSDDSPARNIIDQVTRRLTKNGRRYRALDPTGKDREILQLIADPAFRISGLTNKMLRQHLKNTKIADGCTDKQLSAKISRHPGLDIP
jgi:hypothetical protein